MKFILIAFGAQKTRMHTLKNRRAQNKSLFGADFGPEAHFDLGGLVNKQNCPIWGTENPHAYNESLFGVDSGPEA